MTAYPRTPAKQPERRPRWIVGGATILTFVGLLYLVELIDQLSRHSLDVNGIRPLKTDGLWALFSRRCCMPTGHT
ncbi:rhomboid family protein [Mycobacterium kansasii]|uniref:Rhomboid family protein n=1 Tax=Mycobacterium kansasii TaxID=1768 RepID=A0A1V3XIB1_MYCKA|nr:rhomboid family protein [Mycobacterium kansasii]